MAPSLRLGGRHRPRRGVVGGGGGGGGGGGRVRGGRRTRRAHLRGGRGRPQRGVLARRHLDVDGREQGDEYGDRDGGDGPADLAYPRSAGLHGRAHVREGEGVGVDGRWRTTRSPRAGATAIAVRARNQVVPASVPSPRECAMPSTQASAVQRWRRFQRATPIRARK